MIMKMKNGNNITVILSMCFLSYLLTGCEYFEKKDLQIQELQQAINTAKQVTEKNNRELNKQIELLQNELKQVLESSEQLKSKLQRTLQDLEKARHERQNIQNEWEAYRAKYRVNIRRKAVGEKYEILTLNNDKSFAGVTITRADAASIHISHKGGVARLFFVNLPQEWHERFDYDPMEAAALVAAEKQQQEQAEEHKNKQDKLNRQGESQAVQTAERLKDITRKLEGINRANEQIDLQMRQIKLERKSIGRPTNDVGRTAVRKLSEEWNNIYYAREDNKILKKKLELERDEIIRVRAMPADKH